MTVRRLTVELTDAYDQKLRAIAEQRNLSEEKCILSWVDSFHLDHPIPASKVDAPEPNTKESTGSPPAKSRA